MAKSDAFDRLTELAAALFQAPIALITALDDERQWFRANRGFGADQTTAQESFCRHMIGSEAGSTMVVEDATLDGRFADNRLVIEEGVRFYAGAVITTEDGQQDGAVCVIDTVARAAPTEAQMESLKLLARLAGQEIDHAKLLRRQAEYIAMLEMSEAMAGMGHWHFEVSTRALTWSDEVFRIHGLEPQSIIPTYQTMSEQYDPEDNAAIWAKIQRALDTGESYDERLRLTRRGEERVTRTQARAERDETGAVVALFGVFQDITESVRAQEQQAEFVETLLLAERMAGIGHWRMDVATKIITWSDEVYRLHGYEPGAVDPTQHSFAEATYPLQDRQETQARIAQAIETGVGYETTMRLSRPNGEQRVGRAQAACEMDAEGKVTALYGVVQDITESVVVQEHQAEMVHMLKLAETVAGIGHWRWNVDTNSVIWSDEVYRIHGLDQATFDPSLDSAVGAYHPDDQLTLKALIEHALATGESYECQLRLIRADGTERITQAKAMCETDAHGHVHTLFGVFQDVTERVRADERIAASEAKYRLLADNSTDVIATYGMDGLFRYLSPAIEGPMGYRPDELVGRAFSDFMHPEDVSGVQKAFADYVRSGPQAQPPRIPYRGIRKDGEVVWLEAHPKLIRDASGMPVEFQDVVRDISETKALEDQLIAARDVAEAGAKAKSEFLANMSHELRTPLTSVIGFSGLLQSSEALPEAERRYADRIATSSEALLSVINDILDYSKLEADAVGLDPTAFDPAEMARSAASIIETQCEAKGLTLAIATSSDLPPAIMGDAGRLRQVTLNLLSNAMKFTASGVIRLDVKAVGERMRVSVTDSGIGIAPEKIASLFERFTQADASTTRVYGGTGLGLAICQRLIEMMGGEIGATSQPGQGSTFWFEVPMIPAEAADAMAQAAADGLPDGLKVLMADDAAANRELVRILLEAWGVELETVCDGAEVVRAAAGGAHDLILMDVHMPVMDGMDASRAIRALGGKAGAVPILALTANVQPEQIEACKAAGMDGHVGKPIQIAELIAQMAGVLKDRPSVLLKKVG